MNESQKAQKEHARSMAFKCTEGLDGSYGSGPMEKANEHGDASMDRAVSPASQAQGMRAEMGEKI